MTDIEVSRIDQTKDHITHFALFSNCDSTNFEIVFKEKRRLKEMDDHTDVIDFSYYLPMLTIDLQVVPLILHG